MNNKLRYWVKLDSNNVPVIGSNINRPRTKTPKAGRWREIETVDCCGPELTYAADATITNIEFILLCDASPILTVTLTDDSVSLQNLADILNNKLSFIGYFSVDETNIVLKVKKKVSDVLCDGTLTFTAEPA